MSTWLFTCSKSKVPLMIKLKTASFYPALFFSIFSKIPHCALIQICTLIYLLSKFHPEHLFGSARLFGTLLDWNRVLEIGKTVIMLLVLLTKAIVIHAWKGRWVFSIYSSVKFQNAKLRLFLFVNHFPKKKNG